MVEIAWESLADDRVRADAVGFTALIAKREGGWGWTIRIGDEITTSRDGGLCKNLEEAKKDAGAILMQKIKDGTDEVARLKMIENRNAKAFSALNGKNR